MATINELIREVKDVRGTEVKVFGNITKIDEEVSPYLIDTVDILKQFDIYDAEMVMEVYTGDEDEEVKEVYTSDIEEFLEYLDNRYGLEEIHHGNTYNWGSNVSNDLDFITYKVSDSDEYYVKLMVHKGYGDIRANYTDYCLLKFDYENEFLDILSESYVLETVTIDDIDYLIDIYATSDTITVSARNEDGEVYDIGYLYGYYENEDEIKVAIKELIV